MNLYWLEGTIVLSTPLILAAMGGLLSERSGVVNIGLEGKMLLSAFAIAWATAQFHSPVIGLAVGLLVGILLALTHWMLTQTYRVDHIISGMAINAVGLALPEFCAQRFLDPTSIGVKTLPMPVFWGLALALPITIALYLSRTKGGLRLLAVGNDPGKSRQMGVNPVLVRFLALIGCGLLCGLAGGFFVTNAGNYEPNMTAGKGFIALAALIVGQWRPLPTLAACLFVGGLQQLQIVFQGVPVLGVEIPGWVWVSLPYLVTVVALAGFFGRSRPPAGLGKP